MKKQLIYDVGVNNGTDTAYYIHRGYKVLGIEANPVMVSLLEDKFSSEIESGTFTLLNLGIAETEGELKFWVCEDPSRLLMKARPRIGGAPQLSSAVPCARFSIRGDG